MTLWTIADLHLSLSVPQKTMEAFGDPWIGYQEAIAENWKKVVREEDIVLIPGDITWAMTTEQALIDLRWIDALPGRKVISKGNHDYWWPSNAKLKTLLPPSLHFVQGTALLLDDIAICGTRLWDVPSLSFGEIITYKENPLAAEGKRAPSEEETRKIYLRELGRLKIALEALDKSAAYKVAMVHYPPTSIDLIDTEVTALLESYGVNACVFGHLHNVTSQKSLFGEKNGIIYHFASADYLHFTPKKIR